VTTTNERTHFILSDTTPARVVLDAIGAADASEASQIPATLTHEQFPAMYWSLTGFDWSGHIGNVGIEYSQPEDAMGPNVLQLRQAEPGAEYVGCVQGRTLTADVRWNVTARGNATEGALGASGSDALPIYLSQTPSTSAEELYLGWDASWDPASGAGGPTKGVPSSGPQTSWALCATSDLTHSERMVWWRSRVVMADLTAPKMLAAIWNKSLNTPWAKSMCPTILAWTFHYPFVSNPANWAAEAGDAIYQQVYYPFILSDDPGWGEGDPPLPPPPGVR
jgi:hypothetical protein